MIDLKKWLKSFTYAWKGFLFVWNEEQNFRFQLVIALIITIAMIIGKFTYVEFSLAFLTFALVLGGEVINTVVEDTLNKLEPGHDPLVGKIKDMAAFFIMINATVALVIAIIVLVHHFR